MEIKDINKVVIVAVNGNDCNLCIFKGKRECLAPEQFSCGGAFRNDKRNVIFILDTFE